MDRDTRRAVEEYRHTEAGPIENNLIDELVSGELGHLVEDGELKGQLGRTTFLHTSGRLAAHRVAAAGIGF